MVRRFFVIIFLLSCGGSFLFAADLWYCVNSGIEDMKISSIVINTQNEVFVAGDSSGVWFSSDEGLNWFPVNNGLDSNVTTLAINSKGVVFAGTSSNRIFKSTDKGNNWELVKYSAFTNHIIRTIFIDELDNIFVSIDFEGIYFSSNGGLKWNYFGLITSDSITSITKDIDGNLLAGTYSNGLLRTKDFGQTWDSGYKPDWNILSVLVNKRGYVIVGTEHGKIFVSTDNGLTWENNASLYYDVKCLVESAEGNIFAGLNNNGPYWSPDFGVLWGPFTNGIGKRDVYVLGIDSKEQIYGGTATGVYKNIPGWKALEPPDYLKPTRGEQDIPIDYRFSWYKVRGADFYNLMISTKSDFTDTVFFSGNIPEEFCNITGLENDKKYYWQVRSIRMDTIGSWGEASNFRTRIHKPDLIKPQNHSKNLDTAIILEWSKVNEADDYILEICLNESFLETDLIYSKQTSGNTSHTITLDCGNKYYWRVKAINAVSKSEWSEIRNFGTLMKAPKLLKPTVEEFNTELTPEFEWEEYGDVTNYQFELSKDSNFVNVVFFDYKINSENLILDSLDYSTRYFWRLRVKFSELFSYWSKTRSFLTGSQAPGLLKPINNSMRIPLSVLLEWNSKKIDNGYFIQIALNKNFKPIFLQDSTLNINSFQLNNLSQSTMYYWRVKSKLQNGYSLWSETWNFETGLIPPMLLKPNKSDDNLDLPVVFQWMRYKIGAEYFIEISLDSNFKGNIKKYSIVKDTSFLIYDLNFGKQYFCRLKARFGMDTTLWSEPVQFNIKEKKYVVPELQYPPNDTADMPLIINFQWSSLGKGINYQIQISKSMDFSNLVNDNDTLIYNWCEIPDFENDMDYYWHVRKKGENNIWSDVSHFKTLKKINVDDAVNETMTLTVFPNPFDIQTRICVSGLNDSPRTVKVFDLLGREVVNLNPLNCTNGNCFWEWEPTGIEDGIYLIVLGNSFVFKSAFVIYKY